MRTVEIDNKGMMLDVNTEKPVWCPMTFNTGPGEADSCYARCARFRIEEHGNGNLAMCKDHCIGIIKEKP